MALIANINGKPIYSDKQMAAIVNTRVTFTDGSWCDVSTGEVRSVGSGYINIGDTDGSNAKKITEGPKRVSASALEVRDIVADVQIDTHRHGGIEYTIIGPADQIKAIRAHVQDGTLIIEGDGSRSSSGNMTIVGSGRHGRTVVFGSGVVVNNAFGRGVTTMVTGSGGESAVKVTIKVPQGSPIKANGVRGSVVIGDTNGPLTAQVESSGSVSAERVTTARLTASSSGTIRVRRVDGNVTAQASSSGNIRIEEGSIPTLMATASSSGKVQIGGTAVEAMLSASSSGDIYAAHVQQQPMKDQSSSGHVRVGRIG